jgi:L-ascorbate metabolism protein UlaG (beta-lactamase superfamily)
VDITWYGHACFRIREKGLTIITDPYSKEIGLTVPRIRADVITLSHDHEGHNNPRGIRGQPRVLSCAGEYEIGETFITGVPTFHDGGGGQDRGQNLAFLFDFESLTVCHLGDLGHALDQAQVELLSGVNVLLIPVGGGSTLSPSLAAEVVGTLEPNIAVPMHYQIPGLTRDLAPVSRFLRAMGVKAPPAQEGLRVSANALPENTQVVLLESKGQVA